MFGIGWSEILIILLIVLFVFGIPKIPQIGDALGKGIRNFQKAVKGEEEDKKEDKKEDSDKKAN